MEISTSLRFDHAIAQMGVTQDRLTRTQEQLSSTKEILKPSDAPDKSAAITRLKSVIDQQNSYVSTIKSTQDKFSQQETALKSTSDVVTRLKELAIQAANDTNGPEGRKLIAVEVKGLRDQLLSLANTQDVNGNYIFSGTRANTAAFAADSSGKLVYQGDQTITQVAVGEQRELANNRSGSQAFGRVIRTAADGTQTGVGFFQVIDDLAAALSNGNDAASLQRAVGELDAAQSGVTESIAAVGSGISVLDSQSSVADENLLRLKSTLIGMEDVDYTEAITRMNKDMLALQAAQSSFAKISQLNLFDYIK
ncbi:MAG: flagellar hook-associated protein FlgL [Burkholderiaceae bacterium]